MKRTDAPAKAAEPTFRRRALTLDEVARLLNVAERRGRSELEGLERAACYALAALAGLRRGETRGATWADIDLDAGTVTVRASVAKNGREATLPLHDAPRAVLRRLRPLRGPGAGPAVVSCVPETRTLYGDLRAVGIAPENDDGRIDFHALRTSFVTNLARADVTLAQAQKLARHSTPTLTANSYTRLQLSDGAAAVARLDVATRNPAVHPAVDEAGLAPSALDSDPGDAPNIIEGPERDSSNPGQEPQDSQHSGKWWRERDSNPRRHSQQIYSLPSLTA